MGANLDHEGEHGDVLEASDGYVRDYLLPDDDAIPATKRVTAVLKVARRNSHLLTAAVSAAGSAAITVTLMLVTTLSSTGAPINGNTGTDDSLCYAYYNATPGSAAFFRLGDAIVTFDSC
jgi:hypothetical protein